MVPLEWASGVMPKPDPTVINKHIRKLVEVSGWESGDRAPEGPFLFPEYSIVAQESAMKTALWWVGEI